MQDALRNYPSVRVSEEQVNAAAAGIQLARTAYLPRIDALAQVNRATRNNIFGMLLPQGVLPNISGPPLNSSNFGTAWGSAAGVLVSWEPFDFGLRDANVAIANAARSRSLAPRLHSSLGPIRRRSPSQLPDCWNCRPMIRPCLSIQP